MSQIITIALADDHTLFRSGLAALLSEFPEIQIVFQAGNGHELQQQINKQCLPDVILMDINMPIMDGRSTTAWLKTNHPTIKVIALSMFNDEKEVINMLRSGATAYLLKESDPRQLVEAITAVHQQGVYFNEMVSGRLLHAVLHQPPKENFSARELEFFSHCCTELSYKEIASKMNVSVRTVDNYRDALFLKLNIHSRTGLVLYCIKNHLVKI